MATITSLKTARLIIGLLFLAVLASNVWTISRWNEARGVYDDLCYLRQAHLFQRFGIDGLRTDIARDDDAFAQKKFREIGYPEWEKPHRIPCHTRIGNAHVLQYPPGTGFLLSL